MRKLSQINENIFDGIGKRSKGDEIRKEDRWGNHDFVDGNGVRHKYGRKATDDNISELVCELLDLRGVDADMNDIDVSEVTNMDHLFSHMNARENNKKIASFCGDISGWQTGNVKIFNCFLQSNASFNGDISGWDVHSCEDFSNMFEDSNFNGDISKWNVESGKDFSWMFKGNKKFNCDISGWNMKNATCVICMFYECPQYAHDLSNWILPNLKPVVWNKEYMNSNKITELDKVNIKSRYDNFMNHKQNDHENYEWYKKAEAEYEELREQLNEQKNKVNEKNRQRRSRRYGTN